MYGKADGRGELHSPISRQLYRLIQWVEKWHRHFYGPEFVLGDVVEPTPKHKALLKRGGVDPDIKWEVVSISTDGETLELVTYNVVDHPHTAKTSSVRRVRP